MESFRQAAAAAKVTIRHLKPGQYRLTVRRTGYRANDAESAYIEMGQPAASTNAQLSRLTELTRDLPETDKRISVDAKGLFTLSVPMRGNDVVLLMLTPADGVIRRPPISAGSASEP